MSIGKTFKESFQKAARSLETGRDGLVSFLDALFVGRISDKVLNLADQLAVWVI